MSFNRSQAQVNCEKMFSCSSNEKFVSKRKSFELHCFSESEANSITNGLNIDALHLYTKGIHSLFEAILSIDKKYYSWSIIKLYYANYYFLRSSLAINGYALIRCKSLYILNAKKGESAKKKVEKGIEAITKL
ncbi:MAG: hypothetical protein AB4426_05005 [Xenococcaceae cyanobacterium]